MKRVAAFACLLLLASHVNAGPVEDALAAYDKFFAAFTTDDHGRSFALHGCYAKAGRSMADRAVPQFANP
jgi:hypothetical protein